MNRKTVAERAQILHLLVEGNSLRSTSRIAGCSINTVTKLLVEIGEACEWYQDKYLRNLTCSKVKVDEIWSFVYSKQKNVPDGKKVEAGDVWTWTAIDSETKLVPSWRIGSRDGDIALDFITDLSARMSNRIQLTSDGHKAYLEAVEQAFGDDVDYAQLVKIYGETTEGQRRYSPANCIGAKKAKVTGNPNLCCVSPPHVERQKLTMRMSMQRFTRFTNAFLKKIENHAHTIALHYMHYNFCQIHKTLRVAPAIAAGVSEKLWDLEEVVNMSDGYYYDKQQKKTIN